VTRKGPLPGRPGGALEGARVPENFRLRQVCRYQLELSTGRRQSVFRISKNPMGAADLSQIRWFLGRSKTLWCRLKASWFAQTPRVKVREGTSGGESCCDGPGVMCSEGGLRGSGTTYVEPVRERAQVPRSALRIRSHLPQRTRMEGTARDGASGARQRVPASPLERACEVGTPRAAAGVMSPRGQGGRKPSRRRNTSWTERAG